MTNIYEAAQQALEALRKAMQGNLDFDEALASYEALREALAQQGEQVPKQLYDSACKRADMWQRIAQQGDCQCADQRDCTGACCIPKQQWEQQPDVLAEYTRTDGHRQWESVGAWLYPGDKIAVISAGAAPAAQQAVSSEARARLISSGPNAGRVRPAAPATPIR